jgi:hypothetical protein
MDEALKNLARKHYKPPFQHVEGYIYDADANMVADEPAHALRVRGWGGLLYEGVDPRKLQDLIGEMMADALTLYWKKLELPKVGELVEVVGEGDDEVWYLKPVYKRVAAVSGGTCPPSSFQEYKLPAGP